MADILKFTGNTVLPEDPAAILEKAKGWGLSQVVVIGMDAGGELRFGGSHCEVAGINLMLDLAKRRLLEEADG